MLNAFSHRLLMTVAFLICLLSGPLFAKSTSEALLISESIGHPNQRPESITCVTHEFAPYITRNKGMTSGIEAFVFEQLQTRLGIAFKIEIMPWARALADTSVGEYDCIFAVFKTPERMEYLEYTTVPIHISSMALFTHKDWISDYQSIDDVQGKSISIVRGFANSESINKLYEEKKVVIDEVTEINRSFEMMSRKRIDLLVYNRLVGEWVLHNLKITNVSALPFRVDDEPAFIAFAKNSALTLLIPEVDNALSDILASPAYQKLVNRYIGLD